MSNNHFSCSLQTKKQMQIILVQSTHYLKKIITGFQPFKLGNNKEKTRNAACCNNCDDFAGHSFILKVSVFSGVYLEPSWTYMMKLFAKIAESC